MPVVTGYITGAGILIGVGQLPNLTATPGGSGTIFDKLYAWGQHLGDTSGIALLVGLGVGALILLLRRWRRTMPAALIALSLATLVSWAADLGGRGLSRIADLASIPASLPSIALPDFAGWTELLPLAVAATVLSLVESSAVARALASKSGQRLDISFEFIGQGIANMASGLAGGYTTSGSLSRSALNEQLGAQTRLAGIFSGLMVGITLLFLGPILDYTPIAALAGLLLVVAIDLVDTVRIKSIIASNRADAFAFIATVVGTWVLPLDKAIYLGVGITVVFVLRRARRLNIMPLLVNVDTVELDLNHNASAIQVLQVDGQLFFAGVNDLAEALDLLLQDKEMRVTVVRLRRALGLDVTAAHVLADYATRYRISGRKLLLVGVTESDQAMLKRSGALEPIGADNIYQSSAQLLDSLKEAVEDAKAFLKTQNLKSSEDASSAAS
jgi:SulP family sulfate permease